MTTTASLLAQVRFMLQDTPTTFRDDFVGDGSARKFDLTAGVVNAAGLVVTTSTAGPLVAGTGYVLDAKAGLVTFTVAPPLNAAISVEGTYFQIFTDAEIISAINTAWLQHTHERLGPLGLPLEMIDLPPVEEYLVAVLAVIQLLWVMITDAARNIDVLVPDGVTIPESQRFNFLMQILSMWQEKYSEMANALGVGMFRIEMSTLRRVSRTTNRLVPVYVAREYDDRTFPERVYPPIDRGV